MTQQTTAADLCTRLVCTVPATLAVNEAARVMHRSHVGSLVAVEETERGQVPVGVITDRDIVISVVARDVDPGTLSVADVMSADLVLRGRGRLAARRAGADATQGAPRREAFRRP